VATVFYPIPIFSANLRTTNIPELITTQGTGAANPFPVQGWAFGVANEALYTERLVLPNFGASNSTMSLLLDWYARTTATTTGSVTWGGSISVLTPSDAISILTDDLATENTQATTTNSTGNGLVRTTVTLSNLDSLTALDNLTLRIRTTLFTSFTGDAVLTAAFFQYSDV
jgi:hypothetical protein